MTFNNCSLCERLKVREDYFIYCEAFPEGIPNEMLYLSDMKRTKKPCANGVLFKSKIDQYIKKE